MNYNDKWDVILNSFKKSFPTMIDKIVEWYPSGRCEITLVFADGSKILYSETTPNTLFNLKKQNHAHISEEEWRRRFAERLFKKLREHGLTQQDLSLMVDISQNAISKYMNARITPNVYTIRRIADALNCSVSELIDFE